jgi:class 3 adenylate cyclase/predicted ATPase
MSVGVHAGRFDFFLVGASHRELLVTGPATTEVARMEGTAEAGEILVSPAVASALPPKLIGAAKGPGFLLRSAPSRPAHPAPPIAVPELPEELVLHSVSAQTRDYLLAAIVEPEHRFVTVAFLHFDGTDYMIEHDGPQATADELHRLVSDTQEAVERYGTCFLASDADADGGKLILTGGAPRAMGDDEERMLLTAREIVSADRKISVRIGINRGLVFAGDIGTHYRRTYTVMGDTVNLAARVMAKAPPGEVYATGPVLDRSPTSFNVAELEPFMVKGKAKPVRAWAVRDPVRTRAGDGARTFALIGRDEEMQVLREALKVVRRNEVRLIELVGESGVGKSRLAEELRTEASDLRHVRAVGEVYRSSTPYIAWREILRDLLGIGREEISKVVVDRLNEVVTAYDVSLLPWLPLIASAAGAEMEPTPEVRDLAPEFVRPRLHQAVLGFLRAVARRPTLFEFENAHLMDEASAELLQAFVESEDGGRPWLFLVARREGGPFAAPESSAVRRIGLGPLDQAFTTALALVATEESPVPDHVLKMAIERSAGNPQLLLDLLSAATSGGGALPDSVETAAAVRIDSLSPMDRQLLRRASVLGVSFHPRFLEEVLEPDAPRPDERTWQRLAEFFEPQDEGYVRFRRVVVRDTAYAGLPFRVRKRLHATYGHRLESEVPDPDEVVGLLSLQFFLGGEFDKAWTYSIKAGNKARDIFANADAARFYRRAIETGKKIGMPRQDLLDVFESLGDVLWRARLYGEATRVSREARALARGDTLRLARLVMKRSFIEESAGRLPNSLRWLSRGRRLLLGLEDLEALGLVAEIDAHYSSSLQAQGRNREAIAVATRAIEKGQMAGAERALGQAENMLAAALSILGRPGAIEHWQKALDHFERVGYLPGQAGVLNNLGAGEYFRGNWTEAANLYQRSVDASERVGDPVFAANAKMNIAEVLVDQAHLPEAERLLKDAMRVWRTTGDEYLMGFCLIQLGRLTAMSGRVDEALELFAQARERYLAAGAPGAVLEVDAREADARLLIGDARRALEMCGHIIARFETDEGVNVLAPLVDRLLGYGLMQTGELASAEEAFDRAIAGALARDAQHDVALSMQGMARVHRRLGRTDLELEAEAGVILDRLGIRAVPAYPTLALEVDALK